MEKHNEDCISPSREYKNKEVFNDFTPQGVCDFLKDQIGVEVLPCPYSKEGKAWVSILLTDADYIFYSGQYARIKTLSEKLGFYIEPNGAARVAVFQKPKANF